MSPNDSGGGGSKIGQKSVTYYLNGPLFVLFVNIFLNFKDNLALLNNISLGSAVSINLLSKVIKSLSSYKDIKMRHFSNFNRILVL